MLKTSVKYLMHGLKVTFTSSLNSLSTVRVSPWNSEPQHSSFCASEGDVNQYQ